MRISDRETTFVIGALAGLFLVALVLVFGGTSARETSTKVSSPSPPVIAPQPVRREDFFGSDKRVIQKEIQEGATLVKPFAPITTVVGGAIDIFPPSTSKDTLSEGEIFKRLFSDDKLARLREMQNSFIRVGWLKEQDRVAFTSEENIFTFLERGTEAMIAHDVYAQDQIAQVREAITVRYPEYVAQQKAIILRQQSYLKTFEPLRAHETFARHYATTFFPVAHAQIQGIWDTYGICYKGINPAQTQKGVDLGAFCCNCGFKMVGYIPVYMHDCGPFASSNGNSAICDIHLGCLNEECAGFNNAIWDGPGAANPPYTMKCGCDDPQKTKQSSQ